MTGRMLAFVALAAASGCTRYDLTEPLPAPLSGSLTAEIGGATMRLSPVEDATGYVYYATRVDDFTPEIADELPGAVIVESDAARITLSLAADGAPWYVRAVARRGDRESPATPVLSVLPLPPREMFEPFHWEETDSTGDESYGLPAVIGDLNADGRDDVLAGTPLEDVDDSGRVELWLGSPQSITDATLRHNVWNYPEGGARLGESLATGDFDCDGYGDVAAGIPYDGAGDRGRVRIFSGGPFGPEGTRDLTSPTAVSDTNLAFGIALAAGDANGDGCDDLLVGEAGRGLSPFVHLFLGASGGIDDTPVSRAPEAAQIGAGWGTVLSFAGDMDGDGSEEILVGEPFWAGASGVADRGRVTIFRGLGGLRSPSSPFFLEGPGPGSRFGSSLARAGDVNGDGLADVAVSTRPTTYAAGIIVLRGDPNVTDGVPIGPYLEAGTLAPRAPLAALAADVNADGFDDLLVGDPEVPSMASTSSGAVSVYLGQPAFLSTTASFTLAAPVPLARFYGRGLALGDLDGDGRPHLLVSAPRSDADRGSFFVHELLPTRGPDADAGAPRSVSGLATQFGPTGAHFRDLDATGHRCDWALGPLQSTVDPCTRENVSEVTRGWNGDRGRFFLRLRVTAADGRYGEAFTTLFAEAP